MTPAGTYCAHKASTSLDSVMDPFSGDDGESSTHTVISSLSHPVFSCRLLQHSFRVLHNKDSFSENLLIGGCVSISIPKEETARRKGNGNNTLLPKLNLKPL